MPEFKLSVPVEVRFRDLDALGHVNNAVFLTYFEVARTHYWVRLFDIHSYTQFGFLVARTECNYRSPARFGELLLVAARVTEMKNSSFVFEHEATESKTGRLVADGKSVQVCYDLNTQRSIPIPEEIRQRIMQFEATGA